MMKTLNELVGHTFNSGNLKNSNIIHTGFENTFKEIGGFRKGELVVMGGRPGMGTTTFASQLAIQFAQNGSKVLYSSLEQNSQWMGNKILSVLLNIEFNKILNPSNYHEIFAKKSEILNQTQSLPITISDNLFNVDDFVNTIETNDFDVVIIDIIQYMNSDLLNYKEDIAQTIYTLKKLALKKNILVIALSVVSRRAEFKLGDDKPRLIDLRGYEMIEQLADKVMLLYRPEYYGYTIDESFNDLTNLLELIVCQNKSGKLSNLLFVRNKSFTNFKSFYYENLS